MKVFLVADVAQLGLKGAIVKVSDGYALNFLFPRKLAIEVTAANEQDIIRRSKQVVVHKEVVHAKTSQLAERIKGLKPVIRLKVHDDNKLYGAVSALDIVEMLAAEGIVVAKNQIIFEKTIKTKGSHPVTVKLSNSLQPMFMLKVAAE